MITPIIPDKSAYQKPEGSEGRRQPRPEPGLVGPSNAGTTRLIVALWVIAGVGHVPFP
jgi:hypothetical protein